MAGAGRKHSRRRRPGPGIRPFPAGGFFGWVFTWLGSEEPRRIAVLLQNPSELRPGGGFIGSYTELVIRKGSLESMEVRDINDPDRELTVKIIPPRPLQGLASRWRGG